MRIAFSTRATPPTRPAAGFCITGCVLAAIAMLAGCSPAEKVEHYQVDKPEVLAARYFHDSADRMLAAIVPHGSQFWFFKLTGPVETIEPQAAPFARFLESVHFAGQPDSPPDWTLPTGWTRLPGNENRYATIEVGTGGAPLEISITALPTRSFGSADAAVLSNVNRWRGQMSLRPINASQLSSETTPVDIGGEKSTIIDLTGKFRKSTGGMGGPFAGGQLPPGHPDVAQAFQPDRTTASSTAGVDLPPGHPPISADASATGGNADNPPADAAQNSPQSAPLTFDTPAGWQPGEMNAMRLVAFKVDDGSRKVEITVSALPASPGSADSLANVNRWRGQIELPKTTAEELEHDAKTISVGGLKAIYVELIGPAEPAPRRAIYAVMAASDDQVWFVKMSGDAALAQREKPKFEAFLKSIRFTGK
jgi:hypothetical protein